MFCFDNLGVGAGKDLKKQHLHTEKILTYYREHVMVKMTLFRLKNGTKAIHILEKI